MAGRRRHLVAGILLMLGLGVPASAQDQAGPPPGARGTPQPAAPNDDERTQLPEFLWNSYIGLNVGYLANPFSSAQLESGFRAGAIKVPHAAFGIAMFGHQFHKHLSGQITYIRPAKYVRYERINGGDNSGSVWMAYGAFTLKSQALIRPRLSIYGEAGLSLTNRRGFSLAEGQVVPDAHFLSPVLGAGLEHHVNNSWDIVAGVTYIPAHDRTRQPRAMLLSGGFRYKMYPLPPQRVAEIARTAFVFPKQSISVGYTTHTLGYGVNRFLSGPVAIFWGGKINVHSGAAVHYQRNLFHTRKIFGLDLGVSVSRWRSQQNREAFTTVSLYPLFRFILVRSDRADLYVSYSVAGPTRISRKVIDDRETGNRRFTFQDALGLGVHLGRNKQVLAGIKISHFSNGNLLGGNPGIAVPMTFELGYAF